MPLSTKSEHRLSNINRENEKLLKDRIHLSMEERNLSKKLSQQVHLTDRQLVFLVYVKYVSETAVNTGAVCII